MCCSWNECFDGNSISWQDYTALKVERKTGLDIIRLWQHVPDIIKIALQSPRRHITTQRLNIVTPPSGNTPSNTLLRRTEDFDYQ